jgi:monoterpene epsilon-lactone hydrolase
MMGLKCTVTGQIRIFFCYPNTTIELSFSVCFATGEGSLLVCGSHVVILTERKQKKRKKNMLWWHQVILGVLFMFGFQAFKFGPSQAHLGVGRICVKWAFRIGGILASSKDKPWVTPGAAEPPSGRVTMLQNFVAGNHDLHPAEAQKHCLKTGKFDAEALEVMRRRVPALFRMMLELVPEGQEKPADGDGFPGSIWVDTDFSVEDETAPVVIYLHIGGAVAGSPQDDVGFAYSIHKATGFRTLALKYPLAPENAAPAAGKVVADAIAKLGALRSVVVVAASGGGYPLLQAILDHKAKPAAVVLLSCMIAGKPLPSHTEHQNKDMFAPEMLRCWQDASYPQGSVSLLEKNWTVAAKIPFYLQASANVMLTDDHKEAAAKLAAVGNENVVLDLVPHVPHAFQLYQDILPEANAALVRVRDWIKEQLAR